MFLRHAVVSLIFTLLSLQLFSFDPIRISGVQITYVLNDQGIFIWPRNDFRMSTKLDTSFLSKTANSEVIFRESSKHLLIVSSGKVYILPKYLVPFSVFEDKKPFFSGSFAPLDFQVHHLTFTYEDRPIVESFAVSLLNETTFYLLTSDGPLPWKLALNFSELPIADGRVPLTTYSGDRLGVFGLGFTTGIKHFMFKNNPTPDLGSFRIVQRLISPLGAEAQLVAVLDFPSPPSHQNILDWLRLLSRLPEKPNHAIIPSIAQNLWFGPVAAKLLDGIVVSIPSNCRLELLTEDI